MASGTASRRIDSGTVDLAILEAGDPGARPILLVHGFTGAKEEFAELLPVLAGHGWHAVAPDLRGHGESADPAGPDAYKPALFAADLAGLADALGWPRFALVGHSMGGAVAQRVALDHADRIDALVLMSTFHGPLAIEPALVQLGVAIVRQGGMAALAEALAVRREGDPTAAAARERMEAARPGYAAWSRAKLLACSADMWLSMVHQFGAWPDTLEEVAKLPVPTLVVVGAEDEQMRAQSEALGGAIPGAEMVVMEGVRHSPHMEVPERTEAVLMRFLDGCLPSDVAGGAPGG